MPKVPGHWAKIWAHTPPLFSSPSPLFWVLLHSKFQDLPGFTYIPEQLYYAVLCCCMLIGHVFSYAPRTESQTVHKCPKLHYIAVYILFSHATEVSSKSPCACSYREAQYSKSDCIDFSTKYSNHGYFQLKKDIGVLTFSSQEPSGMSTCWGYGRPRFSVIFSPRWFKSISPILQGMVLTIICFWEH